MQNCNATFFDLEKKANFVERVFDAIDWDNTNGNAGEYKCSKNEDEKEEILTELGRFLDFEKTVVERRITKEEADEAWECSLQDKPCELANFPVPFNEVAEKATAIGVGAFCDSTGETGGICVVFHCEKDDFQLYFS